MKLKHIINIGDSFGKLVVVEYLGKDSHRDRIYKCLCDCGREITARNFYLVKQTSCGKGECHSQYKHGGWPDSKPTVLYQTWQSMRVRCYNKKFKFYKHYGGRGIVVCDEWKDNFEAFRDYVGERPSDKHSIDRIDNDGNYEPGNVKWSTASEQQKNRRTSKKYNNKTFKIDDYI